MYDLTLLQDSGKKGVFPPPLHLPPFKPGEQSHVQERWLQELRDKTTLDEGQAIALCENLNRDLAFTQGPPGTGKTSQARVRKESRVSFRGRMY